MNDLRYAVHAPSSFIGAGSGPIQIVVPGGITPWKRAQRRRLGNGSVVTFTDRNVEAYHATVRMVASRVMDGRPPFSGAIEMSVVAVFAVPVSWSQKRRAQALAGILPKVTKPDVENSVKDALDAMQGVVYGDDRQITILHAGKIYGATPRLAIELRQL